ncbi:MAG: hypothetical protein Q9226_001841 [Calogaya cf. arnoldii]
MLRAATTPFKTAPEKEVMSMDEADDDDKEEPAHKPFARKVRTAVRSSYHARVRQPTLAITDQLPNTGAIPWSLQNLSFPTILYLTTHLQRLFEAYALGYTATLLFIADLASLGNTVALYEAARADIEDESRKGPRCKNIFLQARVKERIEAALENGEILIRGWNDSDEDGTVLYVAEGDFVKIPRELAATEEPLVDMLEQLRRAKIERLRGGYQEFGFSVDCTLPRAKNFLRRALFKEGIKRRKDYHAKLITNGSAYTGAQDALTKQQAKADLTAREFYKG